MRLAAEKSPETLLSWAPRRGRSQGGGGSGGEEGGAGGGCGGDGGTAGGSGMGAEGGGFRIAQTRISASESNRALPTCRSVTKFAETPPHEEVNGPGPVGTATCAH